MYAIQQWDSKTVITFEPTVFGNSIKLTFVSQLMNLATAVGMQLDHMYTTYEIFITIH